MLPTINSIKRTAPSTSISHPGGVGQKARTSILSKPSTVRTSVSDRGSANAPTTSMSRNTAVARLSQSKGDTDEEMRNRNYFEYARRMAIKKKKKK
jgi:hypothetical protein